MVNIIQEYLKYCFVTIVSFIGICLLFLPLNVVLPEFPLQFIPPYYQQFDVWYIFTSLHLQFTSFVLIFAMVMLGLVKIWNEL